ncbi:MAG: sigma-70 family RNA polymerase sigma factor [Candidatus Acidiferrales bacterium]
MFLAVIQGSAGPRDPADGELMERLTARDPTALESLYDRYSRMVYSLALRIAGQPAVAEEIVQDVFLKLWHSADRYRAERGPLGPWLCTLARNRALDHLRLKREKQRRREDSLDGDFTMHTSAPNPETLAQQSQQAVRVRESLSELPAAQQRAIELAYFEGMTHSEIAAALAEPLGTVKSWIRSGLLRMRETLVKQE